MISGFVLFGLAGAVAGSVAYAGQTAPRGRGCLVSNEGLVQDASLHKPSGRQNLPNSITVDVTFHLASTEEDENLITDAIVDAQWKILHDAFAKYNINLVLNSTERVVDNLTGHSFLIYEGPDKGWVNYEEEERKYFTSTRKGGYDALNLYFFSKYSPGATGYCNWPTVIAEGDDVTFGLDSCQLSAMTMPGFTVEQGAFEDWNQGHLAVHEAGHWFGLNHTFAGGCSEPGDFVADTPAQRTQIFGCPVGSDSCPDQPGLDPIHNFMGYTQDNCTNEFTAGQKDRMFETFFGYRREL
ncbi:metalloprotease [Thelonectria olida]|uniref:Metalloprotease n=1 Tax=Thelonectria olida TaxID=1576542 RepID=A0A9P8VP26_9HYPO|nr:metalloprotease [Thelonectria olida]